MLRPSSCHESVFLRRTDRMEERAAQVLGCSGSQVERKETWKAVKARKMVIHPLPFNLQCPTKVSSKQGSR